MICHTQKTIEELGLSCMTAVVELKFDYEPGERPTYYSDGSACPGCGASAELLEAYVRELYTVEGDRVSLDAGWNEYANRVIHRHLEADHERLVEFLLSETWE